MLVVALHAQSHNQTYTVAAQVSERIIVRVTSGHVCLLPTTIISLVNVTPYSVCCAPFCNAVISKSLFLTSSSLYSNLSIHFICMPAILITLSDVVLNLLR